MEKTRKYRFRLPATPAVCLMGLALGVAPALAQQNTVVQPVRPDADAPVHMPKGQTHADAQKLVNESVKVVDKMKANPELATLLAKAKGLFIVPKFGRGALVVGGRGGEGLVTIAQNGSWSDPAFYDLGAVSIGAQAGGSRGPVAFLLMNQKAVNAFKRGNKFSLNAGAGLSIINYSANAQASWGKGDIVMWSDTSGAYAGATVSVSDIDWDNANNHAYYGQKTDLSQILTGAVSNGGADKLRTVLPG